MQSERTQRDERMLTDLEGELQSQITEIRASLSDLMVSPGHEVTSRFLAEAPVEECVRLADTWAVAEAVGMPLGQIKSRLSPDDQLVLELVTGIYSARTAGRGQLLMNDLPEVVRLVDEIVLAGDAGLLR